MKELITVLEPAIVIAITALAGYLGQKLSLYMKAKTSKEQQDQIVQIIKASVQFVEMVTHEGIVADKFEIAKVRAKGIINGMGLEITDEELEMWIEAFVLEIHNEQKLLGGE